MQLKQKIQLPYHQVRFTGVGAADNPMWQILWIAGYPIVNDPLYNHTVFGPNKGKGGIVAKTDEQLIQDLIKIHNAENWLGMDGDAEYSMFKGREKTDNDEEGKFC